MKYKRGDIVKLNPSPSSQYKHVAGYAGVISGIEESHLHTHIGGVPQYRIFVLGPDPNQYVSLSEKEVERP